MVPSFRFFSKCPKYLPQSQKWIMFLKGYILIQKMGLKLIKGLRKRPIKAAHPSMTLN